MEPLGAEINRNGWLMVRRNHFKTQNCPFSKEPCGDHCPLFLEKGKSWSTGCNLEVTLSCTTKVIESGSKASYPVTYLIEKDERPRD